MIERSRRVFGVDLADERNGLVDVVSGYETGRQFFEKSKTGRKILESFLAGQPNQRVSGDHLWSVPVVSSAGMRLKLVVITSLLAAVVGAGSCIALVLGVFSRQALSSPGLLVLSAFLLPLATIIIASIFVYRHTARRRRLQAFLTVVLATLLTISLLILTSILTTRRDRGVPVRPTGPQIAA